MQQNCHENDNILLPTLKVYRAKRFPEAFLNVCVVYTHEHVFMFRRSRSCRAYNMASN